jgi:CRISPR/Cas system-associated exonuclease Cas4 (RecB family)
LLYVAVTRAAKMLVLGEGFSKQAGPWLQWLEQLFETLQPGAIEKARDGKAQSVKFKNSSVKVLPASQWNVPEQLAFAADAILVGEPAIERAPATRVTSVVEMTPSDLGALTGCFRFFHWTRVLGIAEPGSEPTGDTPQMRLGSIAHKMLECATAPPAETLAAAGLSDLNAVFECRDWKELAAVSPERELPFIMHIDVDGHDCWIRGRMDAAVAAEDNAAGGIPRVIDYKYAAWREGAEADYDIQMTAYALALMKSLRTGRAIAELWYLKPPMKIIRREYTLPEADEKVRGLLAQYLDAVKNNEWPVAGRSYCDRVHCGFRETCWGAA